MIMRRLQHTERAYALRLVTSIDLRNGGDVRDTPRTPLSCGMLFFKDDLRPAPAPQYRCCGCGGLIDADDYGGACTDCISAHIERQYSQGRAG